MPTIEPNRAHCWVYTFKDGLLSPIAHDLKLNVERFSIDVEPTRIEATFDVASLRVICARRDGRDALDLLSSSDRSKIEENIRKDVLHPARHAEARFVSTSVKVNADRALVEGDLTLHGRTKKIQCHATRTGTRWDARIRLHQPDFGIKPFTAMLGALKVQADVEVELAVEVE